MDNSVSPATAALYQRSNDRFHRFCESIGARKSRYTDSIVQLWLASLHEQGYGRSTILTHLSALRHFGQSHGYSCTLTAPRTLLMLKGIQKATPQPTARPAVTLDHLRRIKASAIQIMGPKDSIQFMAMTLSAFFGLMRPSEYCTTTSQHQLECRDIKMGKRQKCFRINFRSFKHNTHAQQITVRSIAERYLCPVHAMRQYIKKFSKSRSSNPLFDISSTEYRHIFRAVIENANIRTKLTPHCLRHGGATWAAKQGWSEARLCAHGRWSSNAFKGYLHAV